MPFRPLRTPIARLRPTRDIRTRPRCCHRQRFWPRNNPAQPPKSGVHNRAQTRDRFRLLNQRLPRFLQRYTTPLLNAPITHVTSFLILHEITAVVPLFVLFGAFHYSGWMPTFSRKGDDEDSATTTAFDEGVKRFGKWLRKRGWVDEEEERQAELAGQIQGDGDGAAPASQVSGQSPNRGTRMIFQFAAAYAVTKALLPVRIAGSVWATPWFARTILVPVGERMGWLLRKIRGR